MPRPSILASYSRLRAWLLRPIGCARWHVPSFFISEPQFVPKNITDLGFLYGQTHGLFDFRKCKIRIFSYQAFHLPQLFCRHFRLSPAILISWFDLSGCMLFLKQSINSRLTDPYCPADCFYFHSVIMIRHNNFPYFHGYYLSSTRCFLFIISHPQFYVEAVVYSSQQI